MPAVTASEPRPWRLLALRRKGPLLHTLVDAEDYNWAVQWGWNTVWKERDNPQSMYVRRAAGRERLTVYLHREIMWRSGCRAWLSLSSPVVDHINGNTFDNRRTNLRWLNRSANGRLSWRNKRVPSLDQIIAGLPRLTREAPDADVPF